MQYPNPKQVPSSIPDNQSIASLVSQLYQYFKDSSTYSQIDRSTLMSLLESVEPERETERARFANSPHPSSLSP